MSFLRTAVACAITILISTAAIDARLDPADGADTDATAFREFLEGSAGHREAWSQVPDLVILSSVMEFTAGNVTGGFAATGEAVSDDDLAGLAADMREALTALTGGRLTDFASVRVEAVAPGATVKLFRRGQIVVGRFRGVQAVAGTLGYGGRTTRQGAITAGAVILDQDFDRGSGDRHLLRTHELGHALGYNHVESRRSVMNPRVGADLTDFDRIAIERAFAPGLPGPLPLPITRQSAAIQN